MTLAIILVIAAVLALVVIFRIAVSRSLQVSLGAHLGGQIQAIDVEAFRNLVNPAEEDYLRQRLPSAQFRVVRRARLRAMAAYIQVAGQNAVALVRIGEAALASDNPRTLEAARQLVNEALLLRRNTTLALAKIYFALAWPGYGLAAVRIAEHYDQLSNSAMLLGRLQNPSVPVRICTLR
ncbi:MAG: hypothetical protein WB562_00145 [Candidatus Sulfotelmatobacter sp.]